MFEFLITWQFWVVVILLIISGIAKACMDVVSFKYSSSIFPKLNKAESYFNPVFSWAKKWKNLDPKQGEAFLGSSTIFVSFTDFWHLMGLIRDFCLFSCIPIIANNYFLFLLYPIYRLIFHIFFTYLFIKK